MEFPTYAGGEEKPEQQDSLKLKNYRDKTDVGCSINVPIAIKLSMFRIV